MESMEEEKASDLMINGSEVNSCLNWPKYGFRDVVVDDKELVEKEGDSDRDWFNCVMSEPEPEPPPPKPDE
jgi:hypothetical protein